MNYLIIIPLLLTSVVHAKSFGVVGETFPMGEMSFLSLIEARLTALKANGELDDLNKRWVERVALHSNRPKALPLARTLHTKAHYYKPEIVLNEPLKDAQGRIIYKAGTTVNALTELPSYKPCWLFINADDEGQLNWAKKAMALCKQHKIILTGGAINFTEKALQTVIYFDQEGRIAKKLHLNAVPAKVVREGDALKIEEFAIKENGDAL